AETCSRQISPFLRDSPGLCVGLLLYGSKRPRRTGVSSACADAAKLRPIALCFGKLLCGCRTVGGSSRLVPARDREESRELLESLHARCRAVQMSIVPGSGRIAENGVEAQSCPCGLQLLAGEDLPPPK